MPITARMKSGDCITDQDAQNAVEVAERFADGLATAAERDETADAIAPKVAYFTTFNGFVAGTVALTVYTAAFIAEVIRAGILSVAKGQMEAARSSGLTYTQAMYHVVLPQAMKIVIPPKIETIRLPSSNSLNLF